MVIENIEISKYFRAGEENPRNEFMYLNITGVMMCSNLADFFEDLKFVHFFILNLSAGVGTFQSNFGSNS